MAERLHAIRGGDLLTHRPRWAAGILSAGSPTVRVQPSLALCWSGNLLSGCDPRVYVALGVPVYTAIFPCNYGFSPFHQVFVSQRTRLQPMLDDFPFRALSRQFSPEAWLCPFDPSQAASGDQVFQGDDSFNPAPKRRRIRGKQPPPHSPVRAGTVTPPLVSGWDEVAVMASEVAQWADEEVEETPPPVLFKGWYSSADEGEDEVVEEVFTEGAIEAIQQAAMDNQSSPSVGVETGSPIDEGFEGGDRAYFYHPHMCDRFRNGHVICPWDAIFEFCPCSPKGDSRRHLRWSSESRPYLLPRWVVVNQVPIALPDRW